MNIEQIREDLVDDTISYSEALERIKKLPKPWNTKEWTIRRDRLIKDYCEQCHCKSEIFVAQHLTHPKKFSSIRAELLDEKLIEYYSKNEVEKPSVTKEEIEVFKKDFSECRNACPYCKKLTFRERKTMAPKYFCEKCKMYFDQTTKIQYVEKLKSISNDDQISEYIFNGKIIEIRRKIKNKVFEEFENETGKTALLKSISLHFKYVSLENVVTFCKKCASRMDYCNQLLCWNCKENYFDYTIYDNCYKCFLRQETVENPFKGKIWALWLADNNCSLQRLGVKLPDK